MIKNIRFRKRLNSSLGLKIAITVISVFSAIILSSLLFLLNGNNPFSVLLTMAGSIFGSFYGISETLTTMIPIAFCAISVAIAAKIKIWNIGAEGQFVSGALGASIIGIFFPNLPPVTAIILMFLAGITFSLAVSLIPAVLKTLVDVNEILVTLMLNYIVIQFVSFLLYGPLKGADNFPYSKYMPESTFLPILFNSRLHTGIFIVIFVAIILHFMFKKSIWGYQLRVLGESYTAARYAGIPVKRNIILVFILSGIIAGIGGVVEIVGVQHRLQLSISQGFGFTGIIVSWLSKNKMLTILMVSFFIAGLFVSAEDIQIYYSIPSSIIKVFQGMIFLFILGSDIFTRYEIVLEKK